MSHPQSRSGSGSGRMLCSWIFRGWGEEEEGEWAQSDPWNFTLAGSCVLGFALSQAAHWLEGAGCIAEALPFLPSLPRSGDGH